MTDHHEASGPDAGDVEGDSSEFFTGLLFTSIGALALYLGSDYPAGSALDMGPGYLPRLVAMGVVIVGIALTARGALRGAFRGIQFPVRPAIFISAAIIAFALSIERFGLFAACLASSLLASFADARIKARNAILIALVLSAGSVILFGYILRLSTPMWPR